MGRRLTLEEVQARQSFSRMGWALAAQMGSMLATQVVLTLAAMLLCTEVTGQPVFLWAVTALSAYGVGFPVFCLVLRGTPAPARPAPRPMGPLELLKMLAGALCALYLTNFLTLQIIQALGYLLGTTPVNPVEQTTEYPLVLNLVLGCLIAPVCEELMFRRMLLERLRPWGEGFAVVASALCFGLFHGNLSQFFYSTAVGIVLGIAAVRSGSLWQCMLLHAALNAVSVGLMPLMEMLGSTGELVVAGVVMFSILVGGFCLRSLYRHLQFQPARPDLPAEGRWGLFLGSPGMIGFCLLWGMLSATYLIQG